MKYFVNLNIINISVYNHLLTVFIYFTISLTIAVVLVSGEYKGMEPFLRNLKGHTLKYDTVGTY